MAQAQKKPQHNLEAVTDKYPLAITPYLDGLIDHNDPNDPIARQFLPDIAELSVAEEEREDPIGDNKHSPVKGIVHRYPDRVLLKPVHVCAVYCRFCFRREMVGPGQEMLNADELEAALDYIRQNDEIWEVILTGGDPFVLSPRRLGGLIQALDEIEHVQVIRLHTRVPVADPARINHDVTAALNAQKPVYVSIHCNHPRELTDDLAQALSKFTAAGIPLVAQTVLLKGVNDDASVLAELFRGLVKLKVKPYYLHHCDMAPGTSHFRTTIEEGQAIMRRLRGKISGLCLPTYVLDIPGGVKKIPVEGSYLDL